MHLTDHITDVQLNEYLDNESAERTQIKAHLFTCDECATRLTALKTLFAEIESLPELELTQSLTARFTPTLSLQPQLPTWLTLTTTLQAAVAFITVILAAPFIASLLPTIETPSLTDIFLQLQSQWTAWLDALSTFQLPTLPEFSVLKFSSLFITLTLAGASLLWLVGNGFLLRNQR
jgi:hypothetical protein